MKLSPLDVEQQQFPRTLRGYQASEVDTYLSYVASELAKRDAEVAALVHKEHEQAAELIGLREREQNVQGALLTAQRACDELKEQSAREAQFIVDEAELRAQRILESAHAQVAALKVRVQQLRQQKSLLHEDLRGVLETHLRVLGDAPSAYQASPSTYDSEEDEAERYEEMTAEDALRALDSAPPEKEPDAAEDRLWTEQENSII